MILITLDKEAYKQLIGELPDCYIYSCTVNKISDSKEITEVDKAHAMSQYWIRSNSKINDKLNTKLFKFELI